MAAEHRNEGDLRMKVSIGVAIDRQQEFEGGDGEEGKAGKTEVYVSSTVPTQTTTSESQGYAGTSTY